MSYRRQLPGIFLVLFTILSARASSAQESVTRAAAAPPAPPPYSLPWQLRGAGAVSAVRADTTVATFAPAEGMSTTAIVTMLAASYKITPTLSPGVKFAVVATAPVDGDDGTHIANPSFSLTYGPKIAQHVRLAFSGSVALPVGGGGGDMPHPKVAAANKAAALTRSSMDGSTFAVNDFTFTGGLDVAYVAHGLTVQAEASVGQCVRARGEMVQADEYKTNFLSGLYAGYYVLPQLSVGGEVRYQRWLSTPTFIAANPAADLRDSASVAAGVRLHLPFGKGSIRPGFAYGQGLDNPMNGQSFHIVQIDVPIVF